MGEKGRTLHEKRGKRSHPEIGHGVSRFRSSALSPIRESVKASPQRGEEVIKNNHPPEESHFPPAWESLKINLHHFVTHRHVGKPPKYDRFALRIADGRGVPVDTWVALLR